MRILLASSLGGAGHLQPVLDTERACRRLGWETLLVVPPSLAERVASAVTAYRVGGEPAKAVVEEIWQRVRAGGPGTAGLIDRELFAEHATRAMLGTTRSLCRTWRPDLVVREPSEYASAVAAHEMGIPQAQVGISLAALERGVLDMVAPIVDGHSGGVADAIGAAPYLSSFPASLDPSPWADIRRYRTPTPPTQRLPDWWRGDDRPLVYLSFGSVVGRLPEAATLYRTALDAVSGLAVRALLTTGDTLGMSKVDPLPANTRVERWVPQADVLPHAAVVVCHGGSGTTFGALAAGVPVVACPLFADQPRNAALLAAAGAGLVVAPLPARDGAITGLGPADVARLRDAVERVLAEPTYRQAAQRIGAEMSAAPELDEVIGSLRQHH